MRSLLRKLHIAFRFKARQKYKNTPLELETDFQRRVFSCLIHEKYKIKIENTG